MEYNYRLKNGKLSFEDGVTQLQQKYSNKIHVGAINNSEPDCITHLCSEIQQTGISFKEYSINPQDYDQYVSDAQYTIRYPDNYTDNFFEKSLEHHLCYRLLNFRKNDTFVDIASEHSPVGEIFSRLTRCNSYSQGYHV